MRRSPRRGATLEAGNAQIDGRIVQGNNRWKQWEAAQGRTPAFTMEQRYSEGKAKVKSLILFSYLLPSRSSAIHSGTTLGAP